ncbi:hypothetical protein [Solimonas soli]|uniref:hypothetical protein n=1 Tax=Solimonas soli TaxID=413479 RepID=UPI000484CBA3|nr:hypothetical protein [Solimonas soli]
MTENEALTVATRLYVRMRTGGGRVIDAVWMTQNVEYAREVLRLAYTHPDGEVQRLAARFEEVVFGSPARPALAVAASSAAARSPAAPATPNKYIGVLR